MYVEMLIAEMRDRHALAECAEAYTQHVVPLLTTAQGLEAAYLAGEEGDSLLGDRDPRMDVPRSSRNLVERRRPTGTPGNAPPSHAR